MGQEVFCVKRTRAEMNGIKFKIIKDNMKSNGPESAIRINSEKEKSIYRLRINEGK